MREERGEVMGEGRGGASSGGTRGRQVGGEEVNMERWQEGRSERVGEDGKRNGREKVYVREVLEC